MKKQLVGARKKQKLVEDKMPDLKPKIGLEIHVELKTRSKMFCDCKNDPDTTEPNSNICPICLGFPGTLPKANKRAIEWTIKTALALNCKIASQTKFDRKNYFYPDLPKGYQISQYDLPISDDGFLEIDDKKIGITRVHLEEDTAKLLHPEAADLPHQQAGYSLVDFNRSGVPLMEIVTEPDIESAGQAKEFAQKLRLILRYLGVSSADMEKGQMRVEANVSISKDGKEGTKVEVKNLNSFRSVEKAIDYEIDRQKDLLKSDEKIIQETRGWHDTKQITFSQRTKETASDYRYFPEPDLPPQVFKSAGIEKIKQTLPELPDQKIDRFVSDLKLNLNDAKVLVSNFQLASFFEEVVAEKTKPQKAANWILTELKGRLNKAGKTISENKIKPKDLANLILKIESGKISTKIAKDVLDIMVKSGKAPDEIVKNAELQVISGEKELEEICNEIISENSKVVKDFQKGKTQALQFLIGQAMQKTKGRANPKMVVQILNKKLK